MQQPQEVEVRADGAWWPGVILGWRHDDGGLCEVRVRFEVGGAERTCWTQLVDLRLPQPAAVPAGSPEVGPGTVAVPAVSPAATVEPVPASAARRRRHGADVTAEMPTARGLARAGRHRAPTVAGRHRAADEDAGATAEMSSGGAAVLVRSEPDRLTRPMRLGDRVPRSRSRPEVPRAR